MKRVVFLLILIFVSGCISQQSADYKKVVYETNEFQNLSQMFDDIHIDIYELNQTQANEISELVSSIKPEESVLAIVGSKGVYRTGYVYQMDKNGNIIALIKLTDYLQKTNLYYKEYLLLEGKCKGASIEFRNITYENQKLSVTIRNNGFVEFTGVSLYIAGPDTTKVYNETITFDREFVMINDVTNARGVQVSTHNCPFVQISQAV